MCRLSLILCDSLIQRVCNVHRYFYLLLQQKMGTVLTLSLYIDSICCNCWCCFSCESYVCNTLYLLPKVPHFCETVPCIHMLHETDCIICLSYFFTSSSIHSIKLFLQLWVWLTRQLSPMHAMAMGQWTFRHWHQFDTLDEDGQHVYLAVRGNKSRQKTATVVPILAARRTFDQSHPFIGYRVRPAITSFGFSVSTQCSAVCFILYQYKLDVLHKFSNTCIVP